MSLEHALLGFLSYRPLSGYDLKKICDNSVRHFWPADQSQIYRSLTRLSEQGWVEMEVIEQSDRPDRKVYHITPSGSQELHRWLSAPPPPEPNRSAAMVQVFFAGQLSDAEILENFERIAAGMRAGLAQFEAIPQRMEAYQDFVSSPREFYFWMLTLEVGLWTARSNLEFVEEIIRRIKNHELPPQ